MNSAMTPQDGTYVRKTITADEFKEILLAADEVVSSIAYAETQRVVGTALGIEIPMDLKKRNTIIEEDSATILIVKLSYRVCSSMKGLPLGSELSHYEFILTQYTNSVY